MNKIVNLSVTRKSVPTRIDVVQYATKPNIVFVLDDYTPTQSANASLYIEKPDGTKIYNACTIEDNRITYEPTTQSFAVLGTSKCQLQIIDNEDTALSFLIYADVTENIVDASAIESQDEFTALEQALQQIGDLTEIENRLSAVESGIVSVEEDVATNTTNIATNTTNIETNATNIATNTTNIATNTTNISDLQARSQGVIVNAGATVTIKGSSRQTFLVTSTGGTASQHRGAWLVFNSYQGGDVAYIHELKASSSATITGTTDGFTFTASSPSKVLQILSAQAFTIER